MGKKSTNPNAPQKEYANGDTTKGAAFRPSITYDQALEMLVHDAYRRRLTSVLTAKKPSGNKKYNSDPWACYSGKTGQEYDLDGHQVWRVMRSQGCWFLAKHAGAYNEFEFWHISNPPGKTNAIESVNNPGSTVPMNAPIVTNSTPLPSQTAQQSVPVVTTTSNTPTVVKDSWEDDL
jgi:hypothetical protein